MQIKSTVYRNSCKTEFTIIELHRDEDDSINHHGFERKVGTVHSESKKSVKKKNIFQPHFNHDLQVHIRKVVQYLAEDIGLPVTDKVIRSSGHQVFRSSNLQIIRSSDNQVIRSVSHQVIRSSGHFCTYLVTNFLNFSKLPQPMHFGFNLIQENAKKQD